MTLPRRKNGKTRFEHGRLDDARLRVRPPNAIDARLVPPNYACCGAFPSKSKPPMSRAMSKVADGRAASSAFEDSFSRKFKSANH